MLKQGRQFSRAAVKNMTLKLKRELKAAGKSTVCEALGVNAYKLKTSKYR